MPMNASNAFRDSDIALFFAAVGLDAGAEFFATACCATGIQWMLAGACVTMLPLLGSLRLRAPRVEDELHRP
jgi:putative transport protein